MAITGTDRRNAEWLGAPPPTIDKPQATGQVHDGCLVCKNISGYIVEGSDTDGLTIEGIGVGGGTAITDGGIDCGVQKGTTWLENSTTYPLTQEHLDLPCFIEDNCTVAARTTNWVYAGIVRKIGSDGRVLVELGAQVAGDMEARPPAPPSKEYTAADFMAIYVNGGATGDDANSGLIATEPLKTLEAAYKLVPPTGWTTIYTTGTGASKLTPTGGCTPYEGFQGHLRIIGLDDWTEVDTGTVTAYTAAGGTKFSRDLLTPNWSAHALAATDDAYWVEITDDASAKHIRKVMERIVNDYDLEEDTGLTVTGANAIRLINPATHIDFGGSAYTNCEAGKGDVMFIGCKVDAHGADNSLFGFGFASCIVDGQAHDTALELGPNSTFTAYPSLAAGIADVAHVPTAMLAGSELEGKLTSCTYLPGSYIEGKAGGSGQMQGQLAFAMGAGRLFNSVLENIKVFINHKVELTVVGCRGRDAVCGIEASDGSSCWIATSDMAVLYPSEDGCFRLTGDIQAMQVDASGAGDFKSDGSSLRTCTIARAAAHDSVCVTQAIGSVFRKVKFEGGYDLATPGTPQVGFLFEGDIDNCEVDLASGIDRGAGALVQCGYGKQYWGTKFEGDNSNAGGHGLTIKHGIRINVPNAGLTGNAGVTVTFVCGSLGATAYPGATTFQNDFAAAGALTALEECVTLYQRA